MPLKKSVQRKTRYAQLKSTLMATILMSVSALTLLRILLNVKKKI